MQESTLKTTEKRETQEDVRFGIKTEIKTERLCETDIGTTPKNGENETANIMNCIKKKYAQKRERRGKRSHD